MTESTVSARLLDAGVKHLELALIPEGSNRYVYDVVTQKGNLIARFNREGRPSRDPLYGGRISVSREVANIEILCGLGVPVPDVIYQSDDLLVVTRLPGCTWSSFMEQSGHAGFAFLSSMKHLGEVVARYHSIEGDYFCDAGCPGAFEHGRTSFTTRAIDIMAYRMKSVSSVLSAKEIRTLADFFVDRIATAHCDHKQPVFCITDLHGMNFLVDEQGRPSGFFDLDSCQYAHPALEMYGIRMFLFNYYEEAAAAEAAFIEGYSSSGGTYDFCDESNAFWEETLGMLRLFEFCVSYRGARDGLRDSWSERFKELLFRGIGTGAMPWRETALILAEKTGQRQKTL